MDPPADGMGLQPEKLEEEKEAGPLFHCDLCDADIVYKIAQSFLPGLASACIDNTTGGLFKTPATVAVDIRREMVDYLIQRSENFVAESVVLEGGPDVEASIDPYDVISDFVDDFVSSKRNFFSRVSGWLLSDKREDWIDDFVQEIELNGFWLLSRRNTVAQTLLKNLDFKNVYHCNMNFKSQEDLEKHKFDCSFRTMTCSNEGCDSSFSAAQMENHDSTCPFKMLQCEQNCPAIIMRREMDRHCITTCPMKLVKCPFYSVGCQSTVPQCTIEQHRSENISGHLLCILQVLHKEAAPEDLKERVVEIEKLSSPGRLESARDARSLTFAIKDLEAKLGPIKIKTKAKSDEEEEKELVDKKEEVQEDKELVDKKEEVQEDKELVDKKEEVQEDKELDDKKEEKTGKAAKHVRFDKLPSAKDVIVDTHSDSSSDHEDSSHRKEESTESSTTAPVQPSYEKEADSSTSVHENSEDSPVKRQEEESLGSPPERRVDDEQVEPTRESSSSDEDGQEHGPAPERSVDEDEQIGKSSKEEVVESMEEEDSTTQAKQDNSIEVTGNETHPESSSDEDEASAEPPAKNESPHREEHLETSDNDSDKSTPHKEETDDS